MKQRARVKYYDNHYLHYEKCSDDSEEEISLLTRNVKKPQNFVEADVLSGDTLQAIALRFNCSVESLKKANNIHKDNEIFAKGKLKIPINAFSLLTENFPQVHTSGNNSPTKSRALEAANPNKPPLPSDTALQQKLIVAAVNTAEVKPSPPKKPNNVTVNNTLLNSNVISVNDFEVDHIVDEAVPFLTHSAPLPRPTVEDVVLNEFTKKGDTLGIKWFHLLCFALILVVLPLIYIFYIFEHPEKYHHHD